MSKTFTVVRQVTAKDPPMTIRDALERASLGPSLEKFSATNYYNYVLPLFLGRNHAIQTWHLKKMLECQYLDSYIPHPGNGGREVRGKKVGGRKYVMDTPHNRQVLSDLNDLPKDSRRNSVVKDKCFDGLYQEAVIRMMKEVQGLFEYYQENGIANFISDRNQIQLSQMPMTEMREEEDGVMREYPKTDSCGHTVYGPGVDLSYYLRECLVPCGSLGMLAFRARNHFLLLYEKRYGDTTYNGKPIIPCFPTYGLVWRWDAYTPLVFRQDEFLMSRVKYERAVGDNTTNQREFERRLLFQWQRRFLGAESHLKPALRRDIRFGEW